MSELSLAANCPDSRPIAPAVEAVFDHATSPGHPVEHLDALAARSKLRDHLPDHGGRLVCDCALARIVVSGSPRSSTYVTSTRPIPPPSVSAPPSSATSTVSTPDAPRPLVRLAPQSIPWRAVADNLENCSLLCRRPHVSLSRADEARPRTRRTMEGDVRKNNPPGWCLARSQTDQRTRASRSSGEAARAARVGGPKRSVTWSTPQIREQGGGRRSCRPLSDQPRFCPSLRVQALRRRSGTGTPGARSLYGGGHPPSARVRELGDAGR